MPPCSPDRALARDEHLAHARLPRDGGGGRVDLRRADRAPPRRGHRRGRRRRRRRTRRAPPTAATASSSVEIDPVVQRLPRDRAIHRAGVDVAIAEPRRDRARDGALAGARRAVDGDDEPALVSLVRARGSGPGRSVLDWLTLLLSTAHAPADEGAAAPVVVIAAAAGRASPRTATCARRAFVVRRPACRGSRAAPQRWRRERVRRAGADGAMARRRAARAALHAARRVRPRRCCSCRASTRQASTSRGSCGSRATSRRCGTPS